MKRKFLILFLLAFLFIYLGYMIVMLNIYKSEKIDIDNSSIFKNTITIKSIESDNDIKLGELTFKDFFEGYVSKDSFKVKYVDNEIVNFYSINTSKQYINMLNMKAFSFDLNDELIVDTEKNMKDYLKKNNINNDIGLINYIKDNYYINNTILTDVKTMRNNYIINSFVSVTLPSFNSITLINGDINGYILNTDKIRDIHLIYKDKQYMITLSGDELITDEFVTSLLSTVKFK